ncbi:hypothetical protein T552_03166 [Pneumocystis carinii B80]|uniref:ABC transporter domain-containing protein n=1 Tax=Pneumocystis carinii (strain B80) TaxID=1408658 RepID=A0A0W4ZBR8_PNEC8|nr:hypothetical protein T552_03166 [Pneumocystis carinii B80]KTW25892.1 hypothetical protein T552_03166 [Pneumocystis carinii B80]
MVKNREKSQNQQKNKHQPFLKADIVIDDGKTKDKMTHVSEKVKKTNQKKDKKIYNFNSDEDDQYDIDCKSEENIENYVEKLKITKKNKESKKNVFNFLNEEIEESEDDVNDEENISNQTQEANHWMHPRSESVLRNLENLSTEDLAEDGRITGTKSLKKEIKDQKPNENKKTRKERKMEYKQKMNETKTLKSKQNGENILDENKDRIATIYSHASGSLITSEETQISKAIAVTGNLVSPLNSKNLQVDKITIQAYGKLLIKESELNLINGRRYGLIAPNGSGKSTLMHAIASNLIPRPPALDVYLLDKEYTPTEMTCIQALLDINEHEKRCLEEELINLLDDPDENYLRISSIEQRIGELETGGSDHKARHILEGLGFTEEMIQQKTCDLSGGWRMRISLARILFVKPTLILLDEPTNHLDFEAIAWLEDYLVHELSGHTLLMTSHSQDTLNEVCTDIIHLYNNHLYYYSGNYDTFKKIRKEKDIQIMKKAKIKENKMEILQKKMSMTGNKQREQAKSRIATMEKKMEKDKQKNKVLEEEIVKEKKLIIRFEECSGGIPSPAIKFRDVSFGFPNKRLLFNNLNFGVDLNSKIALVGPNGAGKTTLIKLLMGALQPISGDITRHHHLRIAQFHQHMNDQLNLDISAVQWLHEISPERSEGSMRGFLGGYGLTGKSQVVPMKQLSDGQRRRVLFAFLGLKNPHIIMFDEPTNALDINTIDALSDAINNFNGGAIIISHDFVLINRVATEIWVIDNGEIKVWDGSIKEYKESLKKKFQEKREKEAELLL